MKKVTLLLCLMLGCMFIVGGSSAGAAMARKSMDREKAITNLYNAFQYDKLELGKYLDAGLSYMELKNICLHAYAAKKPLAEIAQLREKYGWIRVKYLLGLTPEKFAQRELDYKAERLERLFGLNKQLTMKYMKLGYGSHQVKRAMFIASHCDIPVEKILAMKTRRQKWGDICEQLGLPRNACMQ
ncbi:hypothetical protein [uncultured Phascolarctobacterium sp.]|uniref:hypothetical protein n=1 Tax=uncultured Phascolarctobacterium sp. TaxID=512296 RepID=UPI0025F04835|nr:hypothetical protein [uncultured Phascolarctobacterium sp.]